MNNKNIILFVNKVYADAIEAIKYLEKRDKKKYRIALIRDSKKKSKEEKIKATPEEVDIVLYCDFNDPLKLENVLLPHKNDLLAVTCRGEVNIHNFAKVIPHVPYLKTPTGESLLWSTDKVAMRYFLRLQDKKISPKFTVVTDSTKSSIQKIKEKVNFPLVLKPAGLAASLLVSICFHEEELEKNLKIIFRKVKKIYKENERKTAPKILVEQFMEGDMYSIDGYVNSRGKIYFCPLVYVKTGRTIGFDDFFGYQQTTPTLLKKKFVQSAEEVATKAAHAMGLRSTSVHVELMKLDDEWKVIELGPRLGGFRHKMYQYSFGINHALNDILIRIPKKPIIPKQRKGYTSVLKFFAKKEGRLVELKGIKKIKEFESVMETKVNKNIGDKCLYAKHGGKSVCEVILFNKSRSRLLADIRRVEQLLSIKTSGK